MNVHKPSGLGVTEALDLSRCSRLFNPEYDRRDVPEAQLVEVFDQYQRSRVLVLGSLDSEILRACVGRLSERFAEHKFIEILNDDLLEHRRAIRTSEKAQPPEMRAVSLSVFKRGNDRDKEPEKKKPGTNEETPREQTEPETTEPETTEPETTEPETTEPETTEPEKTEPEKTEPEKTETEKAESKVSLRDLANARHRDGGGLTLIAWAETESSGFSLHELTDLGAFDDVKKNLDVREWRIIVAVREASIPTDPRILKLQQDLRSIERELAAIPETPPSVDSEDELRHLLERLVRSRFNGRSFLSFARRILTTNEAHGLPDIAAGTSSEVINQAVEHLERLGYLRDESFFDMMAPELGRHLDDFNDCRFAFDSHYRWSAPRRERLVDDRDRLLERLQRISPESTHDGLEFAVLDAVGAMLGGYVEDPADRQAFERQRRRYVWGDTEAAVVMNLRFAIVNHELLGTIRGLASRNIPEPGAEALGRLGPLHQIILFIATFTPDLPPDQFFAIAQGLLEKERVHLNNVLLDGDAESRIWHRDADMALKRCFLETRTLQSKGDGRQVVSWTVPGHGRKWKAALQRHRHFFITRQLDHLIDYCMMTIVTPVGPRVVEKILQVQREHVRMSPEYHSQKWGRRLLEVKRALLEFEDDGDRNEQWWAVKSALSARLRSAVVELCKSLELKNVVSVFLEDITQRGELRSWALELVKALAPLGNFDHFAWLSHLHAISSENSPIVEGVTEAVAELCRAPQEALREEAWKAVSGWLPSDGDDAELTDSHMLGARVALYVVCDSVTVSWESHPLYAVLDGWVKAPREDVPDPIRWIAAPGLVTASEVHLSRFTDSVLQLVLLRPHLLHAEGAESIASGIFDRVFVEFRGELWARFGEQLTAMKERGREHWHPIFVAGVLILWEFRRSIVAADAPSYGAIVSAVARTNPGRTFWTNTCGVLDCFTTALTSARSYVDHYSTDIEGSETLIQLYGCMLGAVLPIRRALELYLSETREIPHE